MQNQLFVAQGGGRRDAGGARGGEEAREQGYRGKGACRCQEGDWVGGRDAVEQRIEQARQRRPDVVLLDVMMPGLDGWKVAERLLDDERTRAIPIVFLSARAEVRDRGRGLDAGGFGYVTKPFNPIELAALVRDVVGRAAGGELARRRRGEIEELRDLL